MLKNDGDWPKNAQDVCKEPMKFANEVEMAPFIVFSRRQGPSGPSQIDRGRLGWNPAPKFW